MHMQDKTPRLNYKAVQHQGEIIVGSILYILHTLLPAPADLNNSELPCFHSVYFHAAYLVLWLAFA